MIVSRSLSPAEPDLMEGRTMRWSVSIISR